MNVRAAGAAGALVFWTMSGCTGGSGGRPDRGPETAHHGDTSPPAAAEGAGNATRANEPSPSVRNFEITTSPRPPFRAGVEARVDVQLTGRNGYHVNQEYPIRLTIQPPEGVRLVRAEFDRSAASSFNEEKAVFGVAFTSPGAGQKVFRGELDFSVCNPQTCLLERQPVTFSVDVQ